MRRVRSALRSLTLASAISLFAMTPDALAHDFDKAGDLLVQKTAASIDDRCHVLKPQQRQTLDSFRHQLAVDPALRDKRTSLAEQAKRHADAVDCAHAVTPVRDAFEDAVAGLAAAGIAPITQALSAGRRCVSLSDSDRDALTAAWRRKTDDVARRFNARIRMKFAMREHAAETGADALSCQSVPALVKAALNPPAAGTKP